MTSVFAVVCSVSPDLHQTKFFATKEKARRHLANLLLERRHKLGVDLIENTDDKFVYLLGWEENRVAFSIIELPVEE
jgi:hypothetical protein